MRNIRAEIKNGKINMDFEGFTGDSCSAEEEKIRILLGKMGVETDVECSDNKREATANGIEERERN